MAVISRLEAVLTLDNRQFLQSLQQSQAALTAFSGRLSALNTQINGLSTNLGRLSNVNVNLRQSTQQAVQPARQLAQQYAIIQQNTRGVTARQLMLANALRGSAQGFQQVSQAVSGGGGGGGGFVGSLLQLQGLRSLTAPALLQAQQMAQAQVSRMRTMAGTAQNPATMTGPGIPAAGSAAYTRAMQRYQQGQQQLATAQQRLTQAQNAYNASTSTSIGNIATQGRNLVTSQPIWVRYGGAITAAAAAVVAFTAAGLKLSEKFVEINNAQRAFQRDVGDADYMKELVAATGGMVNELTLMQRAIKAVNLGLNASDLPTYFKFATIRAAETGESVDYLVDSIVNGIGRQSKLILDNLGISAKRLAEEIEKTGDFGTAAGNIIREELGKTNISVDDVSSGFVKMTTAWDNLVDHIVDSELFDYFDRLATKWADVLNAMRGAPTYDFLKDLRTSVLEDEATTIQRWVDSGATEYVDYLKAVNDELERRAGLVDAVTRPSKVSEILEPGDLEPIFLSDPEDLESQSDLLDAFLAEREKTLADYVRFYNALFGEQNYDPAVAVVKPFEFADEGYLDDIPFDTAKIADTLKALKELKTEIQDVIKVSIELGDVFEDIVVAAFQNFAQTIVEVAEYLADVATGDAAFNGQQLLNSFGDFLRNMGRLMASYGALLIAYGVADAVLKYSPDPYSKIAAGAALLGVGAALAAGGAAISRAVPGGGGSYNSAVSSYSGPQGLDYNREIVMVARGEDLVAVLNRQNFRDGYNL